MRLRQIILKLLKEHIPTSEVWVYGSRVTGTAKHNSDLDMVVFTNSEQSQDVIDLIDAFEESDLLFQVEVFVWDKTPDSFKANIKRKHVVLQKAC